MNNEHTTLLINKDLRPEHFILEWSTCKEHDGVSGTQQALNGATRNADRIWKEVAANRKNDRTAIAKQNNNDWDHVLSQS